MRGIISHFAEVKKTLKEAPFFFLLRILKKKGVKGFWKFDSESWALQGFLKFLGDGLLLWRVWNLKTLYGTSENRRGDRWRWVDCLFMEMMILLML